eukprot:813763-Rhodomonas_salina.2
MIDRAENGTTFEVVAECTRNMVAALWISILHASFNAPQTNQKPFKTPAMFPSQKENVQEFPEPPPLSGLRKQNQTRDARGRDAHPNPSAAVCISLFGAYASATAREFAIYNSNSNM